MAPIYASITLAAYVSNTTWVFLIRDVYGSITLASFFLLLLEYIPGPRLPEVNTKRRRGRVDAQLAPLSQADRMTAIHNVFHRDPRPLGWMKWGILQYCVVRPGSTLAAVILEQLALYCEPSWSWRWGHVYVVTVVSVSVTVAMYCLIQLYSTIHQELKPFKPRLKLFTVQSVLFLTFWQSTLLSGLASLNLVHDTEYLTAYDITTGFTALLETFEMMCLAVVHVWAFSYTPYERMGRTRGGDSPLLERQGPSLLDLSQGQGLLDAQGQVAQVPSHPESPAPPKRQLVHLIQAFTSPVLYVFRGATNQTDNKQEEPLEPRERSFMRTRGYKGLPQDEDYTRGVPGLRSSPLPTLTPEYDDPPPTSLLKSDGYVVPRVEYAKRVSFAPLAKGSYAAPLAKGYVPVPLAGPYAAPQPRGPYVPAPPPKGAYVPAHGPAWSGDGVITPPRTPVFPVPSGSSGVVSPALNASGQVLPTVSAQSRSTVASVHPRPTARSSPTRSSAHLPPTLSSAHPPTLSSAHPPTVAPQPQPASTSRRIRDVYVGGPRGEAFVLPEVYPERSLVLPRSPVSPRSGGAPVSPRSGWIPVSPRSGGIPVSPRSGWIPVSPRSGGIPVSPRSGGIPVSPRSGGIPVSPRSGGTPVSPRSGETPILARSAPLSTGPFAPRSEGAHSGMPSLSPKGSPNTHISPTSAHVLAQTSPLFQQSFSPDVLAGYPPSPVSPPLLHTEEAHPRTSAETQRTQRNSGFTLPHWATGTPTHSQWPSGTTHSRGPSGVTSSRRTSAYTVDPPSPTRGRPLSIFEEAEPPPSSREDSLLVRVFSDTSRTRDSESGGARTSILSVRTGECVSSSNGSEEGAVHPARSVSFRSGMPVMVQLGERRHSISSPSLVSSSFGGRRESYPSTPSSASATPYTTLPSPPEVARPLRRMNANLQLRVPQGPSAQPRTVAPSAPLNPARYPHSTWRTATRSSGLGHVSSVHGTVSHWSPIRPPSTSSLESGLAGRSPARPVPEYTAMSSLSSLSNSDDRYPTAS
ncbi:unnamed protein product [Rhizoctonia solani]|uniref:Uncharacterized protein n=1 Tax=Rhizoctonia solani TaxID=456999 RepID=A0A8H3GQH2_9AGAM|nr:unnamed protein product [Rhizoctonia solani]